MHRAIRRGFTLIELLVVIAIIALLVAILLPALKSARLSAYKAVSMSNIRQITAGCATYREDYKGYWPLVPIFAYASGMTYRYDAGRVYTATELSGWCTWAYGGQNNDKWWATQSATGYGQFDIEAADRPANPYIMPDTEFEAPPRPARLQPTDAARSTLKMKIFRDPADVRSHQHDPNWNDSNVVEESISCYEDVGTSYQFSIKWWNGFEADGTLNRLGWFRTFKFGCERLRQSESFQPSRMVWLNDETADVVVNNDSMNFKLRNGYGDINKSVMAFVDGHGAYHPVYSGLHNPRSYKNELYTFLFEDLRPPP